MPQPPRRRYGVQALADLVAPSIGPVLARQGFGEADVLMHWPEIVGTRLAEHCQPLKLQWAMRPTQRGAEVRGMPAVLIVRVEGAFALALQHMAPVIVEKVNAHLGWACVGKIAMRQGPLPVAKTVRRVNGAVDPAAARRAAQSAAAIDDDALRAALVRLGSRVLARPPS